MDCSPTSTAYRNSVIYARMMARVQAAQAPHLAAGVAMKQLALIPGFDPRQVEQFPLAALNFQISMLMEHPTFGVGCSDHQLRSFLLSPRRYPTGFIERLRFYKSTLYENG